MHSFMLAQFSLMLRAAGDDDVTECDRCERQAANCFAQHRAAWCEADFQDTANALDLCADQAGNSCCADTQG